MANGVLSKGIKLSYSSTIPAATYTDLTDLQSIPNMGGSTDSLEITTLDSAAHVYRTGLKNYGDSLDFKFLYDATQFETLNALTGTIAWKVSLPDGASGAIDTTCTFNGTCSVQLDSVGTNAVLTYTLSVKPSTEMTFV